MKNQVYFRYCRIFWLTAAGLLLTTITGLVVGLVIWNPPYPRTIIFWFKGPQTAVAADF